MSFVEPPRTRTIVVPAMVEARAVAGLCAQVRELGAGRRGEPIECDIGAVVAPDATTLDALARMELTARRYGTTIHFENACPRLVDLLDLIGLGDALAARSSVVAVDRQPEEREQLGVDEEVHPRDAPF